MAKTSTNPDITIRGGLINVPRSAAPTPPPRHQPDTPRTKKQNKIRPDHQVPPAAIATTTDEPPPTAAPAEPPPPTEPAADPPD